MKTHTMTANEAKTAILFSLLVLAMGLPSALGQFNITYYDNYNYDTEKWDNWADPTVDRLQFWNDEYLADFDSGKTVPSDHYRSSIDVFDLRTGFASLDAHIDPVHFDDDDWTPLLSVGDDSVWFAAAAPHHLYAARFEGMVHFAGGETLSLESDDDSYIFLDDNTDWGQAILANPGEHPFQAVSTTVPQGLAGIHKMTVKFADTHQVQAGIRINVNGTALQAVRAATVRIEPETLNLAGNGVLTAFIEPAGEDSVAEIDAGTIQCAGASAVRSTVANDKLIVKFNCQDLQGVVPGDQVEMAVSGQFTDGRWFYGTDTIRVIEQGGKKK